MDKYNVVSIRIPDRHNNGLGLAIECPLIDDRASGVLTVSPDGGVAQIVCKPCLRRDGWSVVRRGMWSWAERVIDGRVYKNTLYKGHLSAVVQRGTPKGRKSRGSWIPYSLEYWSKRHFQVRFR